MSLRWVEEGRKGVAVARGKGHTITEDDPLTWHEDDESAIGYSSTSCYTCGAELYVWGEAVGGEAMRHQCPDTQWREKIVAPTQK